MSDIRKEQLRKDFEEGRIPKSEYIRKMSEIHSAQLFSYSDFIMDTDIREIQITSKRVEVVTRRNGIRLVCDPDDQRLVSNEILNFRDYEVEEVESIIGLIRASSKPEPVFFDIGANIGWYSIRIAQEFRRARLFAFEPIPSTFKLLSEHLKLNCIENVQALNYGLSDENKDVSFYYYREGSGNASLSNVASRDSVELIESRVRKLDDVVNELGVFPDFIKCDVEGAELKVFKGAINTLKTRTPTVLTEMLRKWSAKFNYHPNDIIALFSDIGYECYVIKKGKLVRFYSVTDDTVETNYIFRHQDKHDPQ
jgi:FkbM family methyltransferase